MSKFKTALVLPDIHVPYEDKAAVDLVLRVAEDLKPDTIYQVGDFIDFYPISRYAKDPDRASGTALQDELDQAKNLLERMTDIAPTTILQGNHEERLSKYLLEKAPGLCGLRELTVPRLLGIDSKRSFYKKAGGAYLGKLLLLHGNEISDRGVAVSGGTCRKAVDKLHMSVMHGHIHRLGSYYVTSKGQGVQKGFELGCLCEKSVDYMSFSNWQTGFAIVTYRNDGDKMFDVELQEITDLPGGKRRCMVRGKEYRG